MSYENTSLSKDFNIENDRFMLSRGISFYNRAIEDIYKCDRVIYYLKVEISKKYRQQRAETDKVVSINVLEIF